MQKEKAVSDAAVTQTAIVSIVMTTIMAGLVLFGTFYFLIVTLTKLLTAGGG